MYVVKIKVPIKDKIVSTNAISIIIVSLKIMKRSVIIMIEIVMNVLIPFILSIVVGPRIILIRAIKPANVSM